MEPILIFAMGCLAGSFITHVIDFVGLFQERSRTDPGIRYEPNTAMLDAGAAAYRKNKILGPTPAVMVKAVWKAMYTVSFEQERGRQ